MSPPRPLEEELQNLEESFSLDTAKLKEIVARFQEELAEGLQQHGQNIAQHVTWVMGWPSGNETGAYLTLDLGGTNLRVCWVELFGRGHEIKVTQDHYRLTQEIKTGEAEQLWSFVADCLETFITKHNLAGSDGELIPFAFTFSFPADQSSIDSAVLSTWTKGLDIKGVEGQEVASQLKAVLAKRNLPIRLVAVINDTTGAMIASAYHDPETQVGAIFGTGCNGAYMETSDSVTKMKGADLPRGREVAINCEYGAFDNAHRVLPRNKFDEEIDRASPRPGEQTFEKLSAGYYLGELFRLALLDVYERGLVFDQQDVAALKVPYAFDTGFLSRVENDSSPQQIETKQLFKEMLSIEATAEELLLCKRLAKAIAIRGARLCACGIAAICRNKGINTGHVAADGSVANKHPHFKARWAEAMAEILDWPQDRSEDPIVMTSAEDGSAVGAAIIAAMTDERAKKGDTVGIRDEGAFRLS